MISALKKLTLVEEPITKVTVQCGSAMREVSKSSHGAAWKGLFMRWGSAPAMEPEAQRGGHSRQRDQNPDNLAVIAL